jgi:hypothetical protein
MGPRAIAPNATSSAALLAALPATRISEIHYDNPGTDVNEAVEISGPAGASVAGWKIVPYNGADGKQYTPIITFAAGTTIPATCGTRGVLVSAIAGLQNGSPDGVALVDNTGSVVEFLSYEGVFTAVDGPAATMTSIDIGVAEAGATSEGTTSSLQRDGNGVWSGPKASTFGACNDNSTSGSGPLAKIAVSGTTPLVAGASAQFTAKGFDAADAEVSPQPTFTWTSSQTGVATVSSTGLVQASATLSTT